MFLGHFFNIRWLTDCKKLQIHGIFFRTSSTCGIFVDPQLKFCIFCSDRTENLYGLSRRCHLGAGIGVYWTPKTKDISFLFPSTHHLIHKIVVVFCCETSDWYIHAGNWVTWSIVTISFLGHLVLLGLFFWTLLSFFETSFERWWKKTSPEVIIWDFEQRKEIHRLSLHKVVRKTQRRQLCRVGISESGRDFFFWSQKGDPYMYFLKNTFKPPTGLLRL